MSKASYPLEPLTSVKAAAARLAREDGVSLNQWISVAIAQKIGVVETVADFLGRRSDGAQRSDSMTGMRIWIHRLSRFHAVFPSYCHDMYPMQEPPDFETRSGLFLRLPQPALPALARIFGHAPPGAPAGYDPWRMRGRPAALPLPGTEP